MKILYRSRKEISIVLIVSFFSTVGLSACAKYTTAGAAIGAALGATAGLLIDKNNRWRGAALGALIGGALGGTVTEIAQRASKEAAEKGEPVVYQSEDGMQRVEAIPVSYNEQTQCHKVRERIWQDKQLVRDEIKEICISEKEETPHEF